MFPVAVPFRSFLPSRVFFAEILTPGIGPKLDEFKEAGDSAVGITKDFSVCGRSDDCNSSLLEQGGKGKAERQFAGKMYSDSALAGALEIATLL